MLRQAIYEKFLARFVISQLIHAKQKKLNDAGPFQKIPKKPEGKKRVWFHASSVGELEALWPLIVLGLSDPMFEAIVTVFSVSAEPNFKKIREISTNNLLFVGFAPLEGYWGESFKDLNCDLFVSAKYEAWPELWMTLTREKIPLAIVGAQLRGSLKLIQKMFQLLGASLPKLILICDSEDESQKLGELFLSSTRAIFPDSRWDRVKERSQKISEKFEDLKKKVEILSRPIGILGSFWPECQEIWADNFANTSGSFLIFPHSISEETLTKIESAIQGHGVQVSRLSQITVSSEVVSKIVIVDEMGYLLESYRLGDYAYVGGGFGKGLHSTIEPAIFGLPIVVGPNGIERYSDNDWLLKQGQLTEVHTSFELKKWLEQNMGQSTDQKNKWLNQIALEKVGKSEGLWQFLKNLI